MNSILAMIITLTDRHMSVAPVVYWPSSRCNLKLSIDFAIPLLAIIWTIIAL